MPYFDRFDICAAYQALENDWHKDGWLRERPSNQRRRESIGVQLGRVNYGPAGDYACAWEYLGNDNEREIYIDALVRFGLAKHVEPPSDDLDGACIGAWVLREYRPEFIAEHFPQCVKGGPGKPPSCPHGKGFRCRACYPR